MDIAKQILNIWYLCQGDHLICTCIYTNMSPITAQYMNEYGILSCEYMNG